MMHIAKKMRQFLVSEDGQTYKPVISGRMRPTPAEQGFAFPTPVRAHFAQLRLRSNQPGISVNRTTLGEWKVIGVPGERPSTATEFNIAEPKFGPITAGDTVGLLKVKRAGNLIYERNIIAMESAPGAPIWKRMWHSVLLFFKGLTK